MDHNDTYKIDQTQEEFVQRQDRITALCWDVFERTDLGKELLSLFIEEYIINAPVGDSSLQKQYGDHYVGIREGQNSFIRAIRDRITVYKSKMRNSK
jgi:hypothetical protein